MQSKQKGEQPPDEKNARDQVIHSFILSFFPSFLHSFQTTKIKDDCVIILLNILTCLNRSKILYYAEKFLILSQVPLRFYTITTFKYFYTNFIHGKGYNLFTIICTIKRLLGLNLNQFENT